MPRTTKLRHKSQVVGPVPAMRLAFFHFGATLGRKSGTGRSILVLLSLSGGGLAIGFEIKWERS